MPPGPQRRDYQAHHDPLVRPAIKAAFATGGGVALRWAPLDSHMCQGLNSHYFHIIGDGHQPNSRGLYTHYKDSLLKVG